MQFKNPQNDYVEQVTTPMSWLWVFLWAPIYYAVKGVWTHAVVSFILCAGFGFWTYWIGGFIVGIIYAIMNKGLVRNHYLKKGWIQVSP